VAASVDKVRNPAEDEDDPVVVGGGDGGEEGGGDGGGVGGGEFDAVAVANKIVSSTVCMQLTPSPHVHVLLSNEMTGGLKAYCAIAGRSTMVPVFKPFASKHGQSRS